MISISLMTLDDLNSISDILQEEFDDFWTFNILKSELENKNSKYIIAKEDNIILGFAGLIDTVDQFEITNIVVRKTYRNKGIGTLLLDNLISIAKNNKKDKIYLEVNEKNLPAISIYEKKGFKKCGLRPKYYNNTDDAILMILILK